MSTMVKSDKKSLPAYVVYNIVNIPVKLSSRHFFISP